MNRPSPFNKRRPAMRKSNVLFAVLGIMMLFSMHMLVAEAAVADGAVTIWGAVLAALCCGFWVLGTYDGYSSAMRSTPWVGRVTDEDLDAIIRHCRKEGGDVKFDEELMKVYPTQTWLRQMAKFCVISLVRIDENATGYEIEKPDEVINEAQ